MGHTTLTAVVTAGQGDVQWHNVAISLTKRDTVQARNFLLSETL